MNAPDQVTASRPRRVGLSIGAVLAGLVVIVVLDNLIDLILHTTGIYPPMWSAMADTLYLLAIAYRTVDGILGCYVAARLAPNRPLSHALALGVIGVILSGLGAVATWNAGPEFGPAWYPLTLVAISLPCAWAGGQLASQRRHASAAPEAAGPLSQPVQPSPANWEGWEADLTPESGSPAPGD
jgi:hypothetical protein